ncbi:uncharacterized protein K02A2.6 [Trichonephila clavipes]|nr:uncharacterized protein K02A2.6 [Trichonephila clavipes]
MKVHPDSQKLMTINTHKGLYVCKRLMYGLNGAPAIGQRYVDGLFQASDASPVGIGCVLSYVYLDGSERRIAFASRTLSGSEKKYSQIDTEALSIVWAVKKIYLYLKDRIFTLITDRKPWIAIFGSKRGLPVLAATRLLHYALILQSFEFDIMFRKTIEHVNADFLSRLPKTSEELEVKDDITIFQMSEIEALPVTSKELRQETGKDIELGTLLKSLKGRVLVSDNGSQFKSYEFQQFMHKKGVKHKTSAPFNPSSNGQVELYVATLKQSLRAMHKYEAMLFLKRDIKTWTDLLLPDLKTKIQDQLRRDDFEFRDRKLDVGDRVAHAETAEDISKDLKKELGSSSVQGVHQLMLRFQIYHSIQLKRLTPRRGVQQFQTGHFLGVPGESGDLRRDLFFKEGGDMVYLTATC